MDFRARKRYLNLTLLGVLGLFFWAASITNRPARAASLDQESAATPTPTVTPTPKPCAECHLEITNEWSASPHRAAYTEDLFQHSWENLGKPDECLLCHLTDFRTVSEASLSLGVSCEACHGTTDAAHPPAELAMRSDQEYCGACHPTTLNEARLSGHSTANDVTCITCHDPHSQQILKSDPDALCQECHEKELGAMDDRLDGIHLQENITCVACHTLDVPHTFIENLQNQSASQFLSGFDCRGTILDIMAEPNNSQVYRVAQASMNWPVIHRISKPSETLTCSDCHVMDETWRKEMASLGYTPEQLDTLAWDSSDYPAILPDSQVALVSKPYPSGSWIIWLAGIAVVCILLEVAFTRWLRKQNFGLFSAKLKEPENSKG